MVLGTLTEMDAWLGQTFDSMGVVGQVMRLAFRFGVVMAIFGVWAGVAKAVAKRTFFGPQHMEPTLGGFAARLMQVSFLIIGLVAGLAVLGVDLFAVATSLGLVGLGLTLGMQNTIANVVAGISMAMDRPFTVGDRIQVGDFWGEVEEIGLRSVRILTARREYVIIPNRLMDEREIWNYTIRYPELRVDVELGISYESDTDLAEKICREVAEAHPMIVPFPKPRVIVRGFGDNGLELELWIYVRNARERYVVESDVLRQIKERFDEEGVEIPYARQVNLEYDELPDRGRLPERTEPISEHDEPTILVTTAGERPAQKKAETVLDVVEELGGRLIALNVVDRLNETTRQKGEHAVRPFLEAARRQGVDAEPMVLEGDLEDVVSQLVTSEGVDALVVGVTRRFLQRWTSGGAEDRLRRRLGIPIVTIGEDLEVDAEALDRAKAEIRERYGQED